MNQKQWIAHEESHDKVASLVKRTNMYLLAAPVVVSVVVGVLVGQFIVLPLVGIICGIVLQRGVASASHSAFRVVADSPIASEETHARVYNVVDGLCVVSGDQRPSIVLIDSAYPVAVAAVDSDGGNVIGVSQRFVNDMTRVEVEAVMAHLLWRLRVGHGRLVSYVVGLSQILSKVGLGVIAQRISSREMSAELVTIADIAACQATRFPPAAVSALEKCDIAEGEVDLGAGNFLCFALPTDKQGATSSTRKVSSLDISRPSLSERVAILKEM